MSKTALADETNFHKYLDRVHEAVKSIEIKSKGGTMARAEMSLMVQAGS